MLGSIEKFHLHKRLSLVKYMIESYFSTNHGNYDINKKKKRLQTKIPPPDYSKLLCNVTGLSPCVLYPEKSSKDYQGHLPGVSKVGVYKNPEYFAYHRYSYYQALLELNVYRQPQPSAKRKD